jgi:hypothetical protein
MNKSPPQSPQMVMPSHHVLVYLLIRRKERRQPPGNSSIGGKGTRSSMSATHASTEHHHEPELYQIRLKGHLDDRWAAWFGDLTVTREDTGETLLTGPVVDQAALHGLLRKVRDLGMPLLSVTRLRPSQADA